MRGLRAFGLLLGLALAASSAEARPRRKSACTEAGRAKVVDATHRHAFFGAGTEEGLVVGTAVRIPRPGRDLTCQVDLASDHHARCALAGAPKGERTCFVPAERPAKAGAQATAGPQVVAGAALGPEVRAAVATAAGPHVVDEATPGAGRLAFRADAALTHHTFFVAQGGAYHRQSLQVAVRDIPLGFLGTTANVDLTVLTYAARPDDARFRAGSRAQLYVHETAVARRAVDHDLVLSVGRIRPWHAPGVPFLDGLQVGYRPAQGLEFGVLGGGLPDLVAMEPGLKRWMAGAYAAYAQAWTRARLDVAARGGVVRAPETGTQGEVEASLRLGYQRLGAVWAAGRLAVGDGGPRLASLRAWADVEPVTGLRVSLEGRMRDGGPDPYAPGMVVDADHARAAVRWEGWRGISLGLAGGVGRLSEDDLARGVVGPEVGLPTLFGHAGGLWVGYQEALGWLPGRTAWVQLQLRPAERLSLWLRPLYREDHPEAGALREVGGFAQADLTLLSFLRARASVFGRVPLTDLGTTLGGGGLVARISLVGSY
ncbi:MAG: hypothetical protein KC933_20880 [Myxococcales bacterium]|nr:hypothetical protein [Myxococcales bacterium]